MQARILLPALLALGSPAAQAQQPGDAARIRLGVKAGLSLSSLTGPAAGADQQWLPGPLAGVLAYVPLSAHLALQPEVQYARKGGHLPYQLAYPGGQPVPVAAPIDVRLHYLDVPLLLRGRLGPLVLEAGPQVSWLLRAARSPETGNWGYDDLGSQYDGFDAGVVAGAGVQLQSRLQVGVRYTRSLTNNQTFGPILHNQALQVQAAYLFLLDRRSSY